MFKLMLVRFDRDRGEFADQEFNKFCQEHSIIRIDKEFINCNDNIFYSFFIEYLPRKTAYEKPDLTQLSEIQQKQYNRLRDWRNELAANEGLPAIGASWTMNLAARKPTAGSSSGPAGSWEQMKASSPLPIKSCLWAMSIA
ncbi:MAG: hypothetical protein WC111_10995 [Candidatus Cloacimonadaceae bacterium]